MIFHASVPADDPERVARVMAEVWNGEAFRFPPFPDAWIAMAGDDRGSTFEVYPRDRVIAPGEGDGMATARPDPAQSRYTGFHLAIATGRTAGEILAIGAREGWRAVRCSRGGFFDVVELWIENAVLVEVLTAEMQKDYLAAVTPDLWKRARPPVHAAG
jgi:hypothetical protein